MSVIRVEEVGGNALDRAQKLLAGIPDGTNKAVNNALKRASSYLKTESNKKIREKYAISAANIRANENIKFRYTNGSAVVTFMGRKIPLYRYDGASPKTPTQDKSQLISAMIHGAWKKTYPGVTAAGHQFRSTSPTRLTNTFIATMRSGHTGIFERTGESSGIQERMGSAVPQMVGNEEVQEGLAKAAGERFEERIEHEINRLLNGW